MGKMNCLNSYYIQSDGTNITDRSCTMLSVCSIDEFEEVPYSSHADRVCTPCSDYDSKSILTKSSHAVMQWEAFCSSKSDTDWTLIALAIVLSSLFFLLGCIIYVKRFRGDVTVFVGDANNDSKVDVADIIAKFDLNNDGKLSAEETDALLQYTKDSVQFHNSLMKMICPCFVTRPASLRIVKRKKVMRKKKRAETADYHDNSGASSSSDDDESDTKDGSGSYYHDKAEKKASERE